MYKEEAPMLERREASCAAAICSNRDQASHVDLAPSRETNPVSGEPTLMLD